MVLSNRNKLHDLPVNWVSETSEEGNGALEKLRPELTDAVTYDTSVHAAYQPAIYSISLQLEIKE